MVSRTPASPTPAAASAFPQSPAASSPQYPNTHEHHTPPNHTKQNHHRSNPPRKQGTALQTRARAGAGAGAGPHHTRAPDPWWRGWRGARRRQSGPSLRPRRGRRARGRRSRASRRRLGLASPSSSSPSPPPQVLLRFGASAPKSQTPPSFRSLVVSATLREGGGAVLVGPGDASAVLLLAFPLLLWDWEGRKGSGEKATTTDPTVANVQVAARTARISPKTRESR